MTTTLAKIQTLQASVKTAPQSSLSPYDPKLFRPYCWTHGFCVNHRHNSTTYKAPGDGHKKEAMAINRLGGTHLGLNDVIEE